MEWIQVVSSNIAAIAYASDTEVLSVNFLNGSTYEYYGVPQIVFDEFLTADSKGRYFNANIKGVFSFNRA